jgi:putative intracellular protease/amidase
MSANISTHGRPRRILMVVASPAVSTTIGGPVGFWASELTHAWYEFTEVGYETALFSPQGGRVEIDALSDPRHPSGYSAHDVISMGFLSTPRLAALLESTKTLAEAKPADYDALYVAGGQAPMFTFRGDAALQGLVRAFYEAGRITALVCHGTAALLDVKLSGGTHLIAGRHMTGFANSEEDFADQVMKAKVMPFRIEDEARKRGANFVAAPAFRPHAVRDGHLITGQQQYSGRAAAALVIEALGR